MSKKFLSALKGGLLAAGCALAMAGPASAIDLKTSAGGPGDGTLTNFTGFDWGSNGQAFIRGFDLTTASAFGATDNFTLDYHGFASSIFATGLQTNLRLPNATGGTYEITIVAHLNETATCLIAGCTTVALATNSGNFSIYLDYTPDANPLAGTGYADTGSILLLQADITGGLASFLGGPAPGGNGTGGGGLFGKITYSNSSMFIDPSLFGYGATTQTSLQLGAFSTADYQKSACFELQGAVGTRGGPCTAVGTETASNFLLQADASTTFQAVPEPGSIALLGLGVFGLALQRRRRSK